MNLKDLADDLAKKAIEEMKGMVFGLWTPVEEKLPEETELFDYIVTVVGPDGKYTDHATFVTDGGYIDNHWHIDTDWIEGDENDWHIIAWMPFPEPYVKEDTK